MTQQLSHTTLTSLAAFLGGQDQALELGLHLDSLGLAIGPKRATPAARPTRSEQKGLTFYNALKAAKQKAFEINPYWATNVSMSHHAIVPSCYRSFKTERGFTIKQPVSIGRIPCATYWPNGQLPVGVEIVPNGPIHQGPLNAPAQPKFVPRYTISAASRRSR